NAPPSTNGWVSFHHTECCDGNIPHPFTLVDFDGDGVKEVFAQHHILKVNSGAMTSGGAPTSTDTVVFENHIGDPYGRPRVAAGDVDGDGKEDVIVEADYQVYAIGLDALEQVAFKQRWPYTQQATSGGYTSIILTPANVDHDSAIVRYDGQHETLLTDPDVVAVISSPPYWANIGQDVSNTKSTFGTMTGQTTEESTSLGFTVGWSIGTKENGLFAEAESKLTVEQSMDFSSFQSHSIKRALSYTTSGGQD